MLIQYVIPNCSYRYHAIFFIDASSSVQIEADLVNAIQSMGSQYCEFDWKQAVTALSNKEKADGKGVLLFFDNADDEDLCLNPYIPNNSNVSVIITTRIKTHSSYARDSNIHIGPLEPSQAVELLHSVASVYPESNVESMAIVKELGFLALAVTQAGAYIATTRQIGTYLVSLRKHRDDFMRRKDFDKSCGYSKSTYAAIEMSLATLPPKTLTFLSICSFLHHSQIPQELFQRSSKNGFTHQAYILVDLASLPETLTELASGLEEVFGTDWDDYQYELLVEPLLKRSLMEKTFNAQGQVFHDLHPLVQSCVRDILEKEKREKFARLAGRLVSSSLLFKDDAEESVFYRLLLPHVEEVSKTILKNNASDILTYSVLYRRCGHFMKARALQEYLSKLYVDALGRRHTDSLKIHSFLAFSIMKLGNLEESMKIQREILDIRKETGGHRHVDTITDMINLARTLNSLGQYEESEKMAREGVMLLEKILGRRDSNTIAAISTLSECLGSLGKYEESERMAREVLVLREETLGNQHPLTISAMNNISQCISCLGRHEESEKMAREVLALRKEILGDRHPDTINAMNGLSQFLWRLRRYEESEKIAREVLVLWEEILGHRHPYTITGMSNLSNCLRSLGRYGESEKMVREVLLLRKEILGDRHPNTINAKSNLSHCLRSLGQYEESEKMAQEVLVLREEILGLQHPQTISTRKRLPRHSEVSSTQHETNVIQ